MSIYSKPFIGKLESVYGGVGIKKDGIEYCAGSYDRTEHYNSLNTACGGLALGSYQLFQVMTNGSHIARIIPMSKVVVLPEDTGLTSWEWFECIREVMTDRETALEKRRVAQKEMDARWRSERQWESTQASSNQKS